MATESITLPESIQIAARVRASEAGFSSVEEYVCALIQADIAEELDPETEAKLLEGLESPAREWTRADIDDKIRHFQERHGLGGPK